MLDRSRCTICDDVTVAANCAISTIPINRTLAITNRLSLPGSLRSPCSPVAMISVVFHIASPIPATYPLLRSSWRPRSMNQSTFAHRNIKTMAAAKSLPMPSQGIAIKVTNSGLSSSARTMICSSEAK